MQFSQRTTQILKNFNSINGSLEFARGNKLSTMSASKTIVASATIVESIEETFCVYDLSKFLSTLSLFDEYKIVFHDKYLTLTGTNNSANYYFADPSLITKPAKSTLTLPSVDAKFKLSAENLAAIQKAADVLSLPEVAFIGDGKEAMITSIDSKGVIKDSFSIALGETSETFKAVFKRENLKLLAGEYDVEISKKGISAFTSPDVVYWIAVESKVSEFN